jgi:MFS family permease
VPASDSQRGAADAAEFYPRLGAFYEQMTGDEDARVCKDIPESACRHLPRNFFAYLVSNFLTKVADELASARLVLPWLLGAAGAPAAFVGFLVPVREAGALLPRQRSGGVTGLGLLIVASGLASSLSAPLWGRMGDRSSRRVMVIGAAAAGSVGLATWLFETAGLPFMGSPWTYAGLFLLIAMFHSGVRLGRKVYLVDMATQESRSAYAAISNTVIGAAMLAGGAVGVVADLLQSAAVIALLGGVSLFAALYIARLPEVSG